MSSRSLPSLPDERSEPDLLSQAHALMLNGDLPQAEALYRRLLEGGRPSAALLCNLAVIRWQTGRFAEMEQLLRQAQQLQPDDANVHYNLALVLARRGASEEAIAHYRQALPLAPERLRGSIHWNLSKLLLRRGDYAAGWEHYEWRRRKAQPLPPISEPGMPLWDGRSPLDGELVLVGEQGLGDMIQFLRYAPALAARAPRLALALPESLHGLVRLADLPLRLISPAALSAQRTGQWLPLLSVPRLLQVAPERVLVEAPYLRVPPERVEHWRRTLRAGLAAGERVVALHWQGNPAAETSELEGRSLPLAALAPLAELAGVRLVSLQKGAGSDQLAGSAVAARLVACQAEVETCWDFVETGAILLACDLVISSDSALAHLAGALGAPTWLLLHHSSDWRWGETGERSFWYPSLRLFRQRQPGDWAGVIAAVVARLTSTWAEPPPSPQERQQQALQLLQQQRTAEAEAIYRQLLAEGGGNAAVESGLGVLCAGSGRLEEAVTLLSAALRREPDSLSALANLAEVHCQRDEWDKAEPLLQQLLQRDPNHRQALTRLRTLFTRCGRHAEAVVMAERALALADDPVPELWQLGNKYLLGGADVSAARSCYERALLLRPDCLEAQAYLSMVLLLQGEYGRGLELYERRHELNDPFVQPLVTPPHPRWKPGSADASQDPLLVVGEQGLGDMLQFMRYVPELQQDGREVWLCVPDKLVELARLSGLASTVLSPAELKDCSARAPAQWTPLLSLPWHLGVTPEQPLVQDPHLQTSPLRRQAWQRRLQAAARDPGTGRVRAVIGLHWQGATRIGHLQGRSFPLDLLAPLADCEEVAFLSLQKGDGSDQLAGSVFARRVLDCQPEVDAALAFVETAAIVQACDLVITCDTAMAHLAGGLGAPTWLLLPHLPDWRWGLEGERSFWYPSMRLFRQRCAGDWQGVVQDLRPALELWLQQHRRA